MSDHHNTDIAVVIMAGGAGTRFWPLSTEQRPKQFLTVFGERSLLRMTWDRIEGLVPPERVLVLTHRDYRSLACEHLPMIPPQNIIGEPCRRDTAAAVALGAWICRKRFGNPVIVTLTADHLIEPDSLFRDTLLSAAHMAAQMRVLYTFGITPTYPATGYGYLSRGEQVLDDHGVGHFRVSEFHEKPDAETAGQYFQSGNYLWNSGMFVWQTDAIIAEIERSLPNHASAFRSLIPHDGAPDWENALESTFEALDRVSVDVGIMEHAQEVYCVEARFNWRDVGSWHALSDHLPSDDAGNSHRGELVTLDSSDNIIYCEDSEETVMAIGISDLVIVRAGSKTLIAHKDRIEDIKRLTSRLDNSTGS